MHIFTVIKDLINQPRDEVSYSEALLKNNKFCSHIQYGYFPILVFRKKF